MYSNLIQTQAQSNKTVNNFCQLLVTNPAKLLKNRQNTTFYGQAQREKNYRSLRCRQRTKFHLQCILLNRLRVGGAPMKILRQTFMADLKEMFGQVISFRTLDRCLQELKEDGYISAKRGKKNEAKWSSSIYRLLSVDPDVYYFRKLNHYMRQKLVNRSNNSSTKNITISSATSSSRKVILEKVITKAPTPPPNQIIDIDHYWPSGKTLDVLKEQVGDSFLKQEPIIEEYKEWMKSFGITRRLRRELNYQAIPFIKRSASLKARYGTKYVPASKRFLYNSRRIEALPIVSDSLQALDFNSVATKILTLQKDHMKHITSDNRDQPLLSSQWTEEDDADANMLLRAFLKKKGEYIEGDEGEDKAS